MRLLAKTLDPVLRRRQRRSKLGQKLIYDLVQIGNAGRHLIPDSRMVKRHVTMHQDISKGDYLPMTGDSAAQHRVEF